MRRGRARWSSPSPRRRRCAAARRGARSATSAGRPAPGPAVAPHLLLLVRRVVVGQRLLGRGQRPGRPARMRTTPSASDMASSRGRARRRRRRRPTRRGSRTARAGRGGPEGVAVRGHRLLGAARVHVPGEGEAQAEGGRQPRRRSRWSRASRWAAAATSRGSARTPWKGWSSGRPPPPRRSRSMSCAGKSSAPGLAPTAAGPSP